MAVRDSVDFYAAVAGLNQIGVLSGCQVTQDSGSDMKVTIAVGTVIGNAGTVYTVPQTTLPIVLPSAAAGGSSDRRDTIIYTPTVGLQVVQGVPCGTNTWTHSLNVNAPVKTMTPVTTVAAGTNLNASTITLTGANTTAGFPPNGTFTCGGQTVAYTGITNTSFTGCTGGTGSIGGSPQPANGTLLGSIILAEVYVGNATTQIVTATNIVDKTTLVAAASSLSVTETITYPPVQALRGGGTLALLNDNTTLSALPMPTSVTTNGTVFTYSFGSSILGTYGQVGDTFLGWGDGFTPSGYNVGNALNTVTFTIASPTSITTPNAASPGAVTVMGYVRCNPVAYTSLNVSGFGINIPRGAVNLEGTHTYAQTPTIQFGTPAVGFQETRGATNAVVGAVCTCVPSLNVVSFLGLPGAGIWPPLTVVGNLIPPNTYADPIVYGAPTTTIASGTSCAGATIAVKSGSTTAGFNLSGSFTVTTGSGLQTIAYTGLTSSSFTGCSGGAGSTTSDQTATGTQSTTQVTLLTKNAVLIGANVVGAAGTAASQQFLQFVADISGPQTFIAGSEVEGSGLASFVTSTPTQGQPGVGWWQQSYWGGPVFLAFPGGTPGDHNSALIGCRFVNMESIAFMGANTCGPYGIGLMAPDALTGFNSASPASAQTTPLGGSLGVQVGVAIGQFGNDMLTWLPQNGATMNVGLMNPSSTYYPSTTAITYLTGSATLTTGTPVNLNAVSTAGFPAPTFTVNTSGNNGSIATTTTITINTSALTAGIVPGMGVSATGGTGTIPANAYVTSITVGSGGTTATITFSAAGTTGTPTSFSFTGGVVAFQTQYGLQFAAYRTTTATQFTGALLIPNQSLTTVYVAPGQMVLGAVGTTVQTETGSFNLNNMPLPQATIPVVSTTGFATGAIAYICAGGQGSQPITYTGRTSTTLTGASGGVGSATSDTAWAVTGGSSCVCALANYQSIGAAFTVSANATKAALLASASQSALTTGPVILPLVPASAPVSSTASSCTTVSGSYTVVSSAGLNAFAVGMVTPSTVTQFPTGSAYNAVWFSKFTIPGTLTVSSLNQITIPITSSNTGILPGMAITGTAGTGSIAASTTISSILYSGGNAILTLSNNGTNGTVTAVVVSGGVALMSQPATASSTTVTMSAQSPGAFYDGQQLEITNAAAQGSGVALTFAGGGSTGLNLSGQSVRLGPGGVLNLQYETATGLWSEVSHSTGGYVEVPRLSAVSGSGTTVTPGANSNDFVSFVTTAATGTFTVNAPNGTPADGQQLGLRINATNTQTYSWNATYHFGSGASKPTTIVGSATKFDHFQMRYNAVNSWWDVILVAQAVG